MAQFSPWAGRGFVVPMHRGIGELGQALPLFWVIAGGMLIAQEIDHHCPRTLEGGIPQRQAEDGPQVLLEL